tara:strand:+ start:334 stop:783 length:450 start_codon:yes stop_codon:yes gene_type:complete
MIQIQPKMTDTQRKPNVSLKCIEYLILSIQSNPGKGQRFHLRRLHQYQHGFEDYHSGGTNNGFFTNKSYRDVLWTDVAPKAVEYDCYCAVDGWTSNGVAMKSSEAQMHLTRRGWNRANTIRGKIGLSSLDWSAQELPDRGACKIYQTGV